MRRSNIQRLDKAERMLAIPEHAANDPSTNAGATVEQLQAQLNKIMKAEGQASTPTSFRATRSSA
jgi:hypothetical protein